MRYIIPYSFSQQNEFYKVYNTKKKERKERSEKKQKGRGEKNGKKKITVPQNCFDFTASVPLQKYLHKFKEHSFIHCIEYITITYN